ncbi:Hypothetical protein D9617_67g071770 [Elsinoe fawcettii]|nr:Hypothetical protein D9617_67g071770 [Elsinoe fawcettii]
MAHYGSAMDTSSDESDTADQSTQNDQRDQAQGPNELETDGTKKRKRSLSGEHPARPLKLLRSHGRMRDWRDSQQGNPDETAIAENREPDGHGGTQTTRRRRVQEVMNGAGGGRITRATSNNTHEGVAGMRSDGGSMSKERRDKELDKVMAHESRDDELGSPRELEKHSRNSSGRKTSQIEASHDAPRWIQWGSYHYEIVETTNRPFTIERRRRDWKNGPEDLINIKYMKERLSRINSEKALSVTPLDEVKWRRTVVVKATCNDWTCFVFQSLLKEYDRSS